MAEILLSDSYLPLADWSIRDGFVLIEGRRGTGKTRAILSILLARALAYPGSRWLLARSTRTRASSTRFGSLRGDCGSASKRR